MADSMINEPISISIRYEGGFMPVKAFNIDEMRLTQYGLKLFGFRRNLKHKLTNISTQTIFDRPLEYGISSSYECPRPCGCQIDASIILL